MTQSDGGGRAGIGVTSLFHKISDQNVKRCDLEKLIKLSSILELGASPIVVDFLILSVFFVHIYDCDKD